MTWRDVFDTTHRWWGDMALAGVAAKEAGYKFFCWNDRVYSADTYVDTGILVENIGK